MNVEQGQQQATDGVGRMAAIEQQLLETGVGMDADIHAEGGDEVVQRSDGQVVTLDAVRQGDKYGMIHPAVLTAVEQYLPGIQLLKTYIRGSIPLIGDVVGMAGEGVDGGDRGAQTTRQQQGGRGEVLVVASRQFLAVPIGGSDVLRGMGHRRMVGVFGHGRQGRMDVTAKATPIAIIGGGIIGSLTAWFLKRRGAAPIVLERGRLGRQASWAGAGILFPIHPWLYPDAFSRLVAASLAMYPMLARDLKQASGVAIQWHKSGLLIPIFADDAYDHRPAALDWSQRCGWQVEELSPAAVRQVEPAVAADVQAALLWPEVAQVRNPRLLKAVRAALQREGVVVREGVEVTALDERGGHVCGLRLADGSRVAAAQVLLAAGSWSGEVAERFGFALPVAPVKGQIVLLKDKPGRLKHIIKHDSAYCVPRSDGRILIGASMEYVGFRRGNTVAAVHALLHAGLRLLPGLAEVEIERQWMGFRPGSPDGMPFLGPVPGRPGLWVATGHYRNGVALAPITAEIMARWLLEEPQMPDLDLDPFRVDRPLPTSSALGYPANIRA